MARKPLTKTVENTTQAIADALDTPLNLEWDATAELLGLTIPELQERMAAKLDETVFTWANIPAEHQPVVDAVARDIEAENSVRRFDIPNEPQQLPPVAEIPELPEEMRIQLDPQPKKSKRKSTALTEKKTESIKETRQAATQTQTGVAESLTILSAQEGLQDGANAATAYLHGLVTNLTNVKGEGATILAAEILQRTANKQGFNPDEVLQKLGVPLSAQTRENLNDVMGQVLGNVQAATEEMTDTAWGNGYNVQDELTRLSKLMNLNS
jgi:hypothetical protein